MIVLDAHIWIWWVHDDPRLTDPARDAIRANEASGPAVSAISCWEVAMLAAKGRIDLKPTTDEWLSLALAYPGVFLAGLTPRIAVESATLPEPFHRDPADRIIVATARTYDCPLMTVDRLIVDYPHVRHV